MKNITFQKPSSKATFIIVLVLLLIGIPLTLFQSQLQQVFKQFASQTNQSATAICEPDSDNIIISAQFTNRETSKDAIVTAKDIQTGSSVDLGTITPGETKSGDIITEKKSLNAGSVVFSIKWTNGGSGTDSYIAEYKALDACIKPSQAVMCPAGTQNQGYCRWDPLDSAVEYKVVVKDTVSGATVKEETVKHPTTQSAFTMEPNKTYQCSVSPVNACGVGSTEKSQEKTCPISITPYCPAYPQTESSCVWDLLSGATEYKVEIYDVESGKSIKSETIKSPNNRLVYPSVIGKAYKCSVIAVNSCSESPVVMSEPKVCVPTPAPSYAVTPIPTEQIPTPTLAPGETPIPTTPITPTTPAAPTPTNVPVPTPTNMPTPTPRIIQLPPRTIVQPGQTIIQRGGVQTIQQPQTFVQQSSSPAAQPTFAPQPTQTFAARPTVAPTGDNTVPVVIGGMTLIMTFIGAILFFAL